MSIHNLNLRYACVHCCWVFCVCQMIFALEQDHIEHSRTHTRSVINLQTYNSNNFCWYHLSGTNAGWSLTNNHGKICKNEVRREGCECDCDWVREFACECKAVAMLKSGMIEMSPPIALSKWQGTVCYVDAMTSDVIVRTHTHTQARAPAH